MSALDLLNHLLNFAAPAFVVALLLGMCRRWLLPRRSGGTAWWVQTGGVFVAGLLALAGGLVVFGRDGKMLSYVALVLVCGSVQWLLARGWQR